MKSVSQNQALQKNSSKIHLFVISILGTVLEYFEYAIYGFLAPQLAVHFFSESDATTALLKAFGVFAVGSLSKPLGALIFGYLGDRHGRRVSLRYSMIGISLPTFMVGIIPGYETWGWGATAILIGCRMMQGIFVAGESDGVRIYVFEHFSKNHPCLMMCLVGCGTYLGIALASLTASFIPATGQTWRLAFLGCSVLGMVIFLLRRYLQETPLFIHHKNTQPSFDSFGKIIKTHKTALLRTIMLCGAGGGAYHFYLVFQGTYLSQVLGIVPVAETLTNGFWLTLTYVATLPFAGGMADKHGLAYVGKIGGSLTIGLAFLHLSFLMKGIYFLPLMIGITMSMAIFFAPGFLFLMRPYDIGIRFRCMSLGHTLGSMLFSGTTPLVCLFLWQYTNLSYAPFIYFLGLLTMGLIAFIWGDFDQKKKTIPLE